MDINHKLKLWNISSKTCIKEIDIGQHPLSIRFVKDKLVIEFKERIHIYTSNQVVCLNIKFETIHNLPPHDQIAILSDPGVCIYH